MNISQLFLEITIRVQEYLHLIAQQKTLLVFYAGNSYKQYYCLEPLGTLPHVKYIESSYYIKTFKSRVSLYQWSSISSASYRMFVRKSAKSRSCQVNRRTVRNVAGEGLVGIAEGSFVMSKPPTQPARRVLIAALKLCLLFPICEAELELYISPGRKYRFIHSHTNTRALCFYNIYLYI